ncbi:hypothetical protein KY330_02990 [Candidatus Woesearchaeota archaeon]|nr:hypothetical protein [Candidatus Woesearchaeota archaeon]
MVNHLEDIKQYYARNNSILNYLMEYLSDKFNPGVSVELTQKDSSLETDDLEELLSNYRLTITGKDDWTVKCKYVSDTSKFVVYAGIDTRKKADEIAKLVEKQDLDSEYNNLGKKVMLLVDDIQKYANNELKILTRNIWHKFGLPNDEKKKLNLEKYLKRFKAKTMKALMRQCQEGKKYSCFETFVEKNDQGTYNVAARVRINSNGTKQDEIRNWEYTAALVSSFIKAYEEVTGLKLYK